VLAKAKNVPAEKQGTFGIGDVWTFTCIDADTKLVPSFLVGSRDAGCATEFLQDVAGRLSGRVQLTSDGHKMYLSAVEDAFAGAVDFAQLVKIYGAAPEGETRYSPAECLGAEKHAITGCPDPLHISTSYVRGGAGGAPRGRSHRQEAGTLPEGHLPGAGRGGDFKNRTLPIAGCCQIRLNGFELLQRRPQVFDDLGGQNVRLRQVLGGFQIRLVFGVSGRLHTCHQDASIPS
jgi:hypothetical protein